MSIAKMVLIIVLLAIGTWVEHARNSSIKPHLVIHTKWGLLLMILRICQNRS